MKLPSFKTEQWMTDHENDARFNLTDTCVEPLKFSDLMDLDSEKLMNEIVLDYGAITGLPRLKREISSLYRTAHEECITMAHGCSQANEMVMLELLEPGDHVVTFTPSYEQFVRVPESIGCSVSELRLHEENGWQPDADELRASVRPETKMILLNSPNNPTGTVFNKNFLDVCAEICEENGCWMFADEVYRDQKTDSLFDLYPHTIVTGSLSKMYSLAGLRLGWVVADPALTERINRRRDYSIISDGPLTETAGLIALKAKDHLRARSEKIIRESKDAVKMWVRSEPRAELILPEHGTVCFLRYDFPMKSRELAERIQKEYGVFFVPGWCFDCEYHLRLGLTRGADVMREGLNRLSRFMDEYEKGSGQR